MTDDSVISNGDPYQHESPYHYNPSHHLANLVSHIGNAIKSGVSKVTGQVAKNYSTSTLHSAVTESQRQHSQQNAVKGASAAASGYPTKGPNQEKPASSQSSHQAFKPTSQPGAPHTHTPFKATGSTKAGGHATVTPSKPHTSHTAHSIARNSRPQHATAKATGGTQKSSSHGHTAGHPKSTAKGKSKSKSKSKKK